MTTLSSCELSCAQRLAPEHVLELDDEPVLLAAPAISDPVHVVVVDDEQIAAKLSLDKRTVTEIRCVAEREYYGIDEWQKAIEFKDRACRGYAKGGLGFTTSGYFKDRKRNPD